MKSYTAFLKAKVQVAEALGFEISADEVNPLLKPHQVATVMWAVAGGRRAIFKAFGLGKTFDNIEISRICRARAGGMALIILPLGVRQEFMTDAHKLATGDDPVFTDAQREQLQAWQAGRPDRIPRLKFVRSIEECDDPTGLYLANYETVRDGRLDPQRFSVVTLDEADCLRGFGGTKTFREFMALIAGDDRRQMGSRVRRAAVRYRFAFTATPSPNEYIELLAYCAFLGVMDVGQAKTRFFKRNSEKADQLTIHPHKEREFWLWMATWALFVQRPSDLDPSFSDEGYELPHLDVRWHEIPSDHSEAGADLNGQARMFKHQAIGVVDAAREKRDSLPARLAKLMEILDGDRGTARVHAPVLLAEPRSSARTRKGKKQGALSSEPGILQSQGRVLEGEEPSAHARAAAAVPAETRREDCASVQGMAPGEQGAIDRAGQDPQAVEIRPDGGSVSLDADRAAGALCDLPDRDGSASRGPLPQDRQGAGSALPEMQHRPGHVQRSTGTAAQRCGLSDQVVVWCDLNDEQKAIELGLVEAGISVSSLFGNQSVEDREQLLAAWKNGDTAVFLTKPTMYGSGVNLQQCHTMVFAGIGFKFRDFIQAVHRIHRFLQTKPCTVHLIYTEAEREVRRTLERKWQQDKELRQKMAAIIQEFGVSRAAIAQTLRRAVGVERLEVTGPGYVLVNDDCVRETRRMAGNSVGLILTSIPFSTQYEYSPNIADFGHTDSNEHFFQQMDFLLPELLRVLQPGRVAAIHVKNRIVPSGMVEGVGFQTEYPFDVDTVLAFRKHGFHFLGRKTIVTDVVRENASTYRLGWTEQCKDGSRMGFGQNEYLLVFRKAPTDASNGYADVPVVKDKTKYTRGRWQFDAHGFGRSNGNRLLTPEELLALPAAAIFKLFRKHSLERVYDFEHDVRIADALAERSMLPPGFMLLQPQSWHPDTWTDITRMRTLNGAQSASNREMHLCPMQFDIADRAITQYSMPCEEVYDPFGGLMTVPYRAILLGRRGRGCELATGYFMDGATYCKAAADSLSMPALFDLEEMEAAA